MVNIRADDTATPEELLGAMTEAERNEIVSIKRNPRLYDDLAKSLAPGVYGHEDVKRAVLLMLLGGVHKETSEVWQQPMMQWQDTSEPKHKYLKLLIIHVYAHQVFVPICQTLGFWGQVENGQGSQQIRLCGCSHEKVENLW